MSPSRRSISRTVTAGVLTVLLVVVVAAAYGTRQLVSSQEHRLLKQRTDELSLYLTSDTASIGSSLSELGTVARLSPAPLVAFTAAAKLAAKQKGEELALFHENGDNGNASFTMVAGSGPYLSDGESLPAGMVSTAEAATHSSSFLSSPVIELGGQKVLGLLMANVAPPGDVIVQIAELHPERADNRNTSGPYQELKVAIYIGSHPVYNQLIVANVPVAQITGAKVSEVTKVGASQWLLVAAARGTLVGGVEQDTQWFVLGAGILLTALLGALFAVAQRRRDFALDLVDTRTRELNESLETLRRTQDQLVSAERLAAIGELASAVGHELRNPLAVISNALYLVRRAAPEDADPRLTQHLSTAEREVAAATLIVSDLLEYSRSREPMLGNVELTDLIDEALSVAPHPDSVAVDWTAPSPGPVARADRDQLRQVILNFLTNAYDAMADTGGTIRVTTQRDTGGKVRLSVADTGSGMSAETRQRIFEPFFTTKTRGVGLGLAVSHRIVTAHEGSIEVESAPGQGATFTVVLPAAPEPGPDPGSAP